MAFPSSEEEFRAFLTGDHPSLRRSRGRFRQLPSDPRCKTCYAPFGLPGSILASAMGRKRWPKNPKFCDHCGRWLMRTGILGTEIDITILFADVRESTPLAERVGAAEFGRLMDRYYKVATRALIEADGIVDKFVGDGVLGLFIPAMAGRDHSAKAIAAARQIVGTTAEWLPVGAGVHRGIAFVGVIGEAGHLEDFTALGDAVNAAARLGSLAGAGEILVSLAAASAADIEASGASRRTLELRGRSEPLDIIVLNAGV
jgi:adenylate cyclase